MFSDAVENGTIEKNSSVTMGRSCKGIQKARNKDTRKYFLSNYISTRWMLHYTNVWTQYITRYDEMMSAVKILFRRSLNNQLFFTGFKGNVILWGQKPDMASINISSAPDDRYTSDILESIPSPHAAHNCWSTFRFGGVGGRTSLRRRPNVQTYDVSLEVKYLKRICFIANCK